MSVSTEEFDSRNDHILDEHSPFDASVWKWSSKNALYDVSCGHSKLEIVQDYIVKNDLVNEVYDDIE